MIKPQSNAPANMQPWIRTTDKQINDLERMVARLDSLINGAASTDHEQNFNLNNVFSFTRQDDNNVTASAAGMNFTSDVTADGSIGVSGSVVVGNPDRQTLDSDGNPVATAPNFEMSAGSFEINPVTGDGIYTPGYLNMNDSAIDLTVNGLISGDGLSINLSNENQSKRENVAIISVVGDGTYATYEIAKTDATIASYIAGEIATVVGVDPAVYNFENSYIQSVDSSGATLKFTIFSSATDAYIAGGYSTISSTGSVYEGKVSVAGPGPDYYGVTVNQDGLYLGTGAGDPSTALASLTSTALSVPQTISNYLTIAGTNVHVGTTEPASPSNGAIWIDPSKSPVSNSLAYRTAAESYASAAARDLAIPSPIAGMVVYLADVNQLTMYIGSAWYPIAGQMPYFAVRKTATQSITAVTNTQITFSTSSAIDVNRGGFSLSNHWVTVPVAGYYRIRAGINWDTANTTGNNRFIRIYAGNSGAATLVTSNNYWGGLTSDYIAESTAEIRLTAGQVVGLYGYGTAATGSTFSAFGSATAWINATTHLIIEYVGP